MEHRNAHTRLQLLLDVEALGALDVLKVDAAEGRLQRRYDIHEPVDVLLLDLDVEHVNAGELLEQHCFAFHHRLGCQRADVAEAEHGGAVGDDADQVLARGQFGRLRRIIDDGLAGGGHAGGIGEGQIALVSQRLGGLDFQLSGLRIAVIDERAGPEIGGQVALGHRRGFPSLAARVRQRPRRDDPVGRTSCGKGEIGFTAAFQACETPNQSRHPGRGQFWLYLTKIRRSNRFRGIVLTIAKRLGPT